MANLYSPSTGIDYAVVSADIGAVINSLYPNMGFEFHLNLDNNKTPYGFITHIGWVVPIIFSGSNIPLGEVGISSQVEMMRFPILEAKAMKTQSLDLNIVLREIKKIENEYCSLFSDQIDIYLKIKRFEVYTFTKYTQIGLDGKNKIVNLRYPMTVRTDFSSIEKEVEKNQLLLRKLIGGKVEEADIDALCINIDADHLKESLSKDSVIYSPYSNFYVNNISGGNYYRYVLELNNIQNPFSIYPGPIPDIRLYDITIPKKYKGDPCNTYEEEKVLEDIVVDYFYDNEEIYNNMMMAV